MADRFATDRSRIYQTSKHLIWLVTFLVWSAANGRNKINDFIDNSIKREPSTTIRNGRPRRANRKWKANNHINCIGWLGQKGNRIVDVSRHRFGVWIENRFILVAATMSSSFVDSSSGRCSFSTRSWCVWASHVNRTKSNNKIIEKRNDLWFTHFRSFGDYGPIRSVPSLKRRWITWQQSSTRKHCKFIPIIYPSTGRCTTRRFSGNFEMSKVMPLLVTYLWHAVDGQRHDSIQPTIDLPNWHWDKKLAWNLATCGHNVDLSPKALNSFSKNDASSTKTIAIRFRWNGKDENNEKEEKQIVWRRTRNVRMFRNDGTAAKRENFKCFQMFWCDSHGIPFEESSIFQSRFSWSHWACGRFGTLQMPTQHFFCRCSTVDRSVRYWTNAFMKLFNFSLGIPWRSSSPPEC